LIVQEINGLAPELPVITLAPELEQILHKTMQSAGGESTGIEPGLAERLQQSLTQATQQQELQGEPAVLLTSGVLRTTLAKFVKNTIPSLRVLSYQEVPDEKQIRIVNAVGN
jgi:flagellar biosynthesis protein FlhA